MKICGIICEYNPLHNGHVRHLAFSRNFADTIICVMSGDFTQRGTPAIMDKYDRAKHAIMGGADMVIELPAVFSIASAENYAFGAVKILDALKCDFLSFGSEKGDIDILSKCADALLVPPPKLTETIKSNMAAGFSYPSAVSKALISLNPEYSVLDKPNNLLGVEYLKQIKLMKSSMKPVTIKREDNYNSTQMSGKYTSAGAIRTAINNGDTQFLAKYMPEYVLPDIIPMIHEKYQQFVYSFINTATAEYLSKIEGVTEGLENRIIANADKGSYSAFVSSIKTKRYTLVKLQRILLAAVLGISKRTVVSAKNARPYARVLAIRKDRLDLLSHVARSGVNTPDKVNETQKIMIDIDIKASNIYSSLQGINGNRDLTNPLQKV